MQLYNPNAKGGWVAGISFGAWIGMQLLMRRPEIQGFISAALPSNLYDFSFLAPCPSSGLIVNGDRDTLVTVESAEKLVEKLKLQRGLEIGLEIMPGADHFFTGCLDRLNEIVEGYLDMRLAAIEEEAKAPATRRGAKAKPATDDGLPRTMRMVTMPIPMATTRTMLSPRPADPSVNFRIHT